MKTRFHEYLALFRKQRGYTQAQMAELLEISRSTYTNYESGNRAPDFETLEHIGDILKCSLDELFGRAGTSLEKYPNIIRESTAPYQADAKTQDKKRDRKLAIGVQDFRSLRETNGYYVDKTLLIEEFLESGYQVTLITRPRRFGKTLNMSMLAEFLDCAKSSKDVFAGTKISNSYVMREMNEHPVVFLSFLNVKGDTAEEMLYQLTAAVRDEYQRYLHILKSGTLSEEEWKEFNYIYEKLWDMEDGKEAKYCISRSIIVLCKALEACYKKKVYLLLDEYDTPFISANAGGYYHEVRGTLAGMLSSSLKGNPALEKAMLTGIQRVAKENIFSGLNNLVVCTVNESDYSQYFGFTEAETRKLLRYYGMELSDEVKAMYDGYLFGETEIYNPWSVTSCAARKKLDYYWVNTSENSIIRNALESSSDTFISDFKRLITHEMTEVPIEMETSYFEQPDAASLWGLLMNAGMITVVKPFAENLYVVRVPNYEVRKAFQNLTASYMKVEEGYFLRMLLFLEKERMEEFAAEYQQILLELPSYYDLKSENSYHMMMLGMCAFMYKNYEVRSNRESGNGRSDILLCAKKTNLPHMILEFKYTKDETQSLEALAQEAIEQIKVREYDAGMAGEVYYIGLAHCGKKVEVKWEKCKTQRCNYDSNSV